jgi:uncharacterized protein
MAEGQNTKPIEVAQGLHVVAKPIGPACNLNCACCFYREKQVLYGVGEDCRMPDAVKGPLVIQWRHPSVEPKKGFAV